MCWVTDARSDRKVNFSMWCCCLSVFLFVCLFFQRLHEGRRDREQEDRLHRQPPGKIYLVSCFISLTNWLLCFILQFPVRAAQPSGFTITVSCCSSGSKLNMMKSLDFKIQSSAWLVSRDSFFYTTMLAGQTEEKWMAPASILSSLHTLIQRKLNYTEKN